VRVTALLHELRDGEAGRGALADPSGELGLVETDLRGRLAGIVRSDLLDAPAVARLAPIGDDDAIDGVLLGAMAGESNGHGHVVVSTPVPSRQQFKRACRLACRGRRICSCVS